MTWPQSFSVLDSVSEGFIIFVLFSILMKNLWFYTDLDTVELPLRS
jgi:hypothetical protein